MSITVVTSVSAMLSAAASANTGDEIHMTNGAKNNSTRTALVTGASGEIIVKSQNLHGAVMTGAPIDINSPNIRFEGFDMQWSNTSTDYFIINADNVKVRRCKIHFANEANGVERKWVRWKADNGLFEKNEVFGKTTRDCMFLASVNSTTALSGMKVLNNKFHDFVDVTASPTTSEVIRIGESSMAMMDFDSEVAYNQIYDCAADTEVMSIKSSNNNIHHNNLTNVQGSIVLRQAHDCFVESNILKGAGIRFYGHNHKIRNNQIIENAVGGVSRCMFIASGDRAEFEVTVGGGVDAVPGQIIQLNATEAQVRDCEITGNWFMQNAASNNEIWLLGNDTGPFQPDNNTISNNIIQASNGQCTEAWAGTNPASWNDQIMSGNRFNLSGSATVGDLTGLGTKYTLEDPKLSRLASGAYRCAYVLTDAEVGPLAA